MFTVQRFAFVRDESGDKVFSTKAEAYKYIRRMAFEDEDAVYRLQKEMF